MRTLTLTEARRLPILGTMLAGPRPASILEVAAWIGAEEVSLPKLPAPWS